MNSFDSTFEALALHYVGFGIFTVVNNVWTIVALVTAALSFWRLRGSSLPLPPLPSDRREVTPAETDSRPSSSIPDSSEETSTATAIPKVAASPSACEGGVVTKGRFVAYYRVDDRCCCDAAVAADEEEVEAEPCGDHWLAGEWWEGWERALRLRRNGGVVEGTGWYDYQDAAVLSGSVVRLWEEERGRKTAVTPSMTPAARFLCVIN